MLAALALWSAVIVPEAGAAEVLWQGSYRSRALAYESLSLSRDHDQNEGLSAMWDHRLRVNPTITMSSRVAVNFQLDMIPLTTWAMDPAVYDDPVTGDTVPVAYADGVLPHTDEQDGGSYAQNIQTVRAWADIYTDYGRLKFGRMPLEWGAGLILNPGMSHDSEFGDTSDRIQFTTRVGPVYVMAAYDLALEGFVNETDDMHIANAAVIYRTETLAAGFLNRYRFQPSESLHIYTGDIWGKAELGPVVFETEWAATFGTGNLDDGVDDVSIVAFGGMVQALGTFQVPELTGEVLAGLQVGWASGDEDPTDSQIRAFQMDRDFNIALLMFEEPMPILQATVPNSANEGRDTAAVRIGEGVTNAQWVKPWVGYKIMDPLVVRVAYIGARAHKEDPDLTDARGYGHEFDLSLHWTPYEHFRVDAVVGAYKPGPYLHQYVHESLGGGYEDWTFGGRLMGSVRF